jgi:hemerythrin-like domain-containing protein
VDDQKANSNPDDSSLEAILDEHHECMQIVADVEACLDEHPDREGRWMGRMLPRLEALAGTLRSHFKKEEQASLYREVPERFPRFADRLQRLASEHTEILERASDLVRRAGALDHTRIHELREFNAGVQMLVANIRRHEAEENEVILGAHWQEFGEGD